MTRKKKSVVSVKPNDNTVVLSSGVRVKIRPVPPLLLDAILDTIPLPKPPVMKVRTAWGGEEEWYNTNDEKYQEELRKATELRADKSWEAEMLLGIEDEPPEDDKWAKPLKRFGIEIPDDPDERKLLWIKTHLVQKSTDSFKLVAAIRAAARPTEEELREIADSFRSLIPRIETESE